MSDVNEVIDFKRLEMELKEAIQADKMYWLQNDAKIRAVTEQKVASYDEFRDIVAAAHLKPLDPSDRIGSEKHKVIWNPVSLKKRNHQENEAALGMEKDIEETSLGTGNLVKKLKSVSPHERFTVLRKVGPDEIASTFKTEIPVGVFGDILEALSEFPLNTPDIVTTVKILEALSTTKRFNLSLEFLSCTEKNRVVAIMDRLGFSLRDRQQDLAELGITEWTITSLKNTYRLPK